MSASQALITRKKYHLAGVMSHCQPHRVEPKAVGDELRKDRNGGAVKKQPGRESPIAEFLCLPQWSLKGRADRGAGE